MSTVVDSSNDVARPSEAIGDTPSQPEVASQPETTSQPAVASEPETTVEPLPAAAVVFRDLELSEEVQLAVQSTGYISPTPVQEQIIPMMLQGEDVLAQSQTGTGKTAAFALPILSRIDFKVRKPQVLVLAPTRELATQVAQSFETYGQMIPKLKVAAIYGGADYQPQLRMLKQGAQIVVGTPGRVIDHIKRGSFQLDDIRCLVLDEADEMLNMGFIDDVEFVLNASPAEKQIALFSATMPPPIRKIADQHLKNPSTITIKKKTLTADAIEQKCIFVEERDKRSLLARMLEVEETDGVIVFTKTKDSTVAVAEYLADLGIKSAALNGDLPQARRQRTVDQLKAGRLDVVVATDVAARGLDVQRISHVFNFDLPHDGESYVHRIGRTGRAGRSGVAVIFLTHRQRGKLRLIEKVTKKSISIIDPPSAADVTQVRIQRFKEQIAEASKHTDTGLYAKIISEYAGHSGQSLESIAAALAHLANGGRPLVVKEDPRPKRGPQQREASSERGFGNKGDRRPARRSDAGMQRYWIGVGHNDGVRPNNIVGAIANEAGIPGREIGPIKIRDEYSTIDLPEGLPEDVLNLLQATWVSGKQLRIRPFVERGGDRNERRPFDKSRAKGAKFGGKGKKKFGESRFSAAARSDQPGSKSKKKRADKPAKKRKSK